MTFLALVLGAVLFTSVHFLCSWLTITVTINLKLHRAFLSAWQNLLNERRDMSVGIKNIKVSGLVALFYHLDPK